MKKALLMAAAIVAAAPACAEWTLIGKTNPPDEKWYIDIGSSPFVGKIRMAWFLGDWMRPDENGSLSMKGLYEINCTEKQVRFLQTVYYNGPMGSGTVSHYSRQPSSWTHVKPGMMGAFFAEVVCDKHIKPQ